MHDPQTTWMEVSRSATRKTAQEHALVLQAVGIGSGTAQNGAEHLLIVRVGDVERARSEIEKYERENRGWPPREIETPMISQGVHAAIVYGGLLALTYLVQRRESFGLDWLSAGRAQAGLIQDGAWWRSITALCLHADVLHLAGNLVFGAVFGVILAQSIGSGLAWLAFVITGGLGNWLNAHVHGPEHTSIGASTAVFGMLGVQVAYEWMRRRQLAHGRFRRWAPLVMGGALLGWLGSGAEHVDIHNMQKDLDVAVRRIDVWAHVLGFAAGLALGAALGLARKRIALSRWSQAALALSAIAIVAVSWWAAFR